MSRGVFKNYQINLGTPFQIKLPVSFDTIKVIDDDDASVEKCGEQETDPAGCAEQILKNAREEADMIIKEAELEADRLMREAEEKAQERAVEIENSAKQNGYNQGRNEAEKQYEGIIREAELIREHAKAEYREVLAGIESEAVELIMEIVRKVIGMETSSGKEYLLYMVKQAFDRCVNREKIVLKVSQEDYDFLNSSKERLMAMAEGIGELELKKDASLKGGACILETQYGSMDAGVQTKLKKLEEAFSGIIRR